MDKININAVDATQSREGAVEALLGVDIKGEVRRTNITKLDTYSKSEIDSKDDAIKQYTDLQISALIGGATPENLDTIAKLADALQDDDNAINAINSVLSTKYGPDNKPTPAAIGAQPAGSYAASSHTHPWAQITGVPAQATRWPTPAEVGAQPAGSYAAASHTHPWTQITGVPVQATRWPTLTEIGAQPAGSYAAASHTHDYAPSVSATLLGSDSTAVYGRQGLQVSNFSGVGGTGANGTQLPNPTNDWHYHITLNHPNAGGYYVDIAACFHSDSLAFRRVAAGVNYGWRTIYHTGNKPTAADVGAAPTSHTHHWAQITGVPVQATRWPTLAEIGAQAAGSYAAASHSHHWTQISGVPVQATRWPTPAEVGLGNVGNYTSSTGAYANTNALRDGNGDLVARQFHGTHVGDGYNLSRLDWNKLINKPDVANDWINIFNGGIAGRVNKVNIPPQMLNHLRAGRMVEVRAFLNHQGRAGSNRRTMTSIIDGADGWVNYVNDKVSHDMTWYGISSFYVLNASSQHGGDVNSFKSQHQNITRIDMRLL